MAEIIKSNTETTRRRSSKTPSISDLLDHSKLPPQAIDLEEAVLGAMMLEKDAVTWAMEILSEETFYNEAHQKIFTAIRNLYSRSVAIDILTVTEELKKSGNLEIIGGAYYVAQLTNRVASSANIEFHARIIIQKYIQRELIKISSEITKEAYEDSTDVLQLLDDAEKKLFAVAEGHLRKQWADMKTLIKEAITEYQIASQNQGHMTGVGTGFTKLDHITGGFQKSDLIIIASRPSMGKTAFTLTMARNMAVELKKPVAFFSLEMSSQQLVTRLIASETEIDSNKIRNGNLDEYEWKRLHSKINQLSEAPIFIDDTPALTIFELRSKCRKLKQEHDIQAVVIDYLQLMSTGGDNRGNREQEISNISRSLKSIAKELNIPIVVLSQLSRAVETRGGSKKPILSDLRESGAIEQDADVVLFIYRAEYYKLEVDEEGIPSKNLAEIIVAKHRNGAIGNLKLRFTGKIAKFEDYNEFSNEDSEGNAIESNTNFDQGVRTYTMQSKMNDMPNDEKPSEEVPY